MGVPSKLKKAQGRVTVRIDGAVEIKLQAVEHMLKCSRSDAIRHCIMNSNDSVKSLHSAIGEIIDPLRALKSEVANLKRVTGESIRIPAFIEFRARAVAETWEEARGRTFSGEDLVLLGKKYAMMYGIIPNTDDPRSFGFMPENLDISLFRRQVSALVNAQIRRESEGAKL